MKSAWPSIRRERRSPPEGSASKLPVSRTRCIKRTALAALIPNRPAAARLDWPELTAPTNRSRRSFVRAVRTGLLRRFKARIKSQPIREPSADSLRWKTALVVGSGQDISALTVTFHCITSFWPSDFACKCIAGDDPFVFSGP
jgi:hypothetical protein